MHKYRLVRKKTTSYLNPVVFDFDLSTSSLSFDRNLLYLIDAFFTPIATSTTLCTQHEVHRVFAELEKMGYIPSRRRTGQRARL
jgi:hypothetical protein